MKSFFQSALPLTLLLTTSLSAPAPVAQPADGASFPITDLLNTDLTIDEYAAQLENQSLDERTLKKRQYNGDTFNQLTDGTPCRDVTLIYARGTTQAGNVGAADAEGPTFCRCLFMARM